MNHTKIIILIVILLLMFSPILIAFGYQWIMGLKGVSVHEGNSSIFSIFWLSFFTIPAGCLALIGLLIWSLKS